MNIRYQQKNMLQLFLILDFNSLFINTVHFINKEDFKKTEPRYGSSAFVNFLDFSTRISRCVAVQ